MTGGNPMHRTGCGCEECTLTPAERIAKASGVAGIDATDIELANLRASRDEAWARVASAEESERKAQAELETARALLAELKPQIEEWAEHQMYGGFHGGDPRDFVPDPECSTPEEREAHRVACEKAAEGDKHLDDTHKWVVDGETAVHLNINPFGLGTYTWRDAGFAALADRIGAVIQGGKP